MSLEIELPDFDDAVTKPRDFKSYVQVLADQWFKTPKRVATTGAFVLLCLLVIGWNLSRLDILDELAVLKAEEYDLQLQQARLASEFLHLQREGLVDKLARENEKVFQGFPELAAWTDGLTKIADMRNVSLTYKVEKAHFSAVPGILEVPVVLEFKAREAQADSLFTGSLSLLGFVLRDRWHIDVVSTQGLGDGERLLQVVVRAQVWVRDLFGFVDVKELERSLAKEQEFRESEF